MVTNNPLINRVIKAQRVKKQDFFHSSAYGKAQNGGAMGATSTEGFAARRWMEQNRTLVRGYNDSEVMHGRQRPEANNRENSGADSAGSVGTARTAGSMANANGTGTIGRTASAGEQRGGALHQANFGGIGKATAKQPTRGIQGKFGIKAPGK